MTAPHQDPDGGDGYGWDDFALNEADDKIAYLAALLSDSGYDRDAARVTLDQVAAELRLSPATVEAGWRRTVDHESRLSFPRSWHDDTIDPEFVADFARLLAHPQVAVLGGNDNGGDTTHLHPGMVVLSFLGSAGWRARKDTTSEGSWWVLFNTQTGTKARVRLDVHALLAGACPDDSRPSSDVSYPRQFSPSKAASPELVDVKITDACPFESQCGFCYMGSTVNGAAGDPARVMRLLEALADQRVFEIAFGGGEPTLWPRFTEILHYTRALGMVPNFTTKNYAWLTGPYATEWLDVAGAVAFSVNDLRSLRQLTTRVDAAGLGWARNRKITIQLIPDLIGAENFTTIVTEAATRRWRVTLLGYKETGRGTTFTPQYRRDPSWWLATMAEVAQTHRVFSVAIDTALALQSRDALTAAGIPEWLYHVEEGRFSAYVDAVTGRAGPSSYAGDEALSALDLDSGPREISAAFDSLFSAWPTTEDSPVLPSKGPHL